MKKAVVAIVLLVLIAGITWVVLRQARSRSPRALLKALETGRGDRQEILMRLQVARGDLVTSLIEAFQRKDAKPAFRVDVLELLFRKNLRVSDERIQAVLDEALSDPQPKVRHKAAYGFAAFGDERVKARLADHIGSPDPEVRRYAYAVFAARRSWNLAGGVWGLLSKDQRKRMVAACAERMKSEESHDLRFLARSVVGREIEIRCDEATKALHTSDVVKAEELLQSALELDPESHQAKIRLVRHHLAAGDKDKAVELGLKYGAVIKVPRLPTAPAIDGDPTDDVWKQAYTTDKFYHTTSRWVSKPTDGKSRLFLGHHGGKIYVAILGYEEDLGKLKVKCKERDGPVYKDDCVELVFDPDNTESAWYQFVVNVAGFLYDNYRRDRGKNFKCEYKCGIFRDRGYWAVEYALDGKDLDNHPIKPGIMWSLNLFRVRIGAASEHGCIWPTYGNTHRMHLYPLAIFQ